MNKIRVGILGCGNISGIYLKNTTTLFNNLEVRAVADLIPAKARARAEEFGIAQVLTPEQLLAAPDIDVVLNLTVPLVHYQTCVQILEAGKHLYLEKPLSVTLEQGQALVKLASSRGLRLGCAPDTFLGAGIQTCLKLIRDGWIGEPVAASAFLLCGGHEGWHPDPEFYYQTGGGPMLDMGPYYVTALVALLGPVARLSGMTRKTWPHRTIGSQPKKGSVIPVEVPTHWSGLLEFASGAQATLVTSFDAPGGTSHSPIEIYGSTGTLVVPDPNTFGGPIRWRKAGGEWQDLPLLFGYAENSRGLGLSDLARGLLSSTPHRADGALALHVLEVMEGIQGSSDSGGVLALKNRCDRPEALV